MFSDPGGTLTMDKIRGLASLQEASGEDLASSTGCRSRRSSRKPKTPFDDYSSSYDPSGSSQKKEDFSLQGSSEGDVIWKSLVAAILLLIGTAAGFIFLYGLISGDLVTAEKFDDYTLHLEQKSQEKAKDMNAFLASWSVHASSYAILHPEVWPFHQLSHFDQAMTNQQQQQHGVVGADGDDTTLHQVEWMASAPLISVYNREDWEAFSGRHYSDGLATTTTTTDVEVQDMGGRRVLSSSTADTIHPISRINKEGQLTIEQGPGPYLPIFQMHTTAAASDPNETATSHHQDPLLTLSNLNLLSIPVFERAFSLVQTSQEPVLSEPFVWEDVGLSFLSSIDEDAAEEPYTFLINPIFGRHEIKQEKEGNNSSENKDVVGVVIGLVPYKAFFENIIPQDMKGISLVVQPSLQCTKSYYKREDYSFQINGHNVVYKGIGDTHDDNYDFHQKILGFDHFLSFHHLRHPDISSHEELTMTTAYCAYDVYIYPTGGFYDIFRSNTPRLFAGFLVVIFLLVVFVLNMYNYLVKHKEMQTQNEAKRSIAIMDMFFPEDVKNRLMDNQQAATATAQDELTKENTFKGGTPRSDDMFSGDAINEAAKMLDDKPIASLFPACTVIFADIAGFTSWSSERSPEEVFILLETIYGEFDKIAKRRKVFKVETIGDCYLAVTGIPEAQEDHAVRMCSFARDCMMKMYEVTQKLEITLGPETTDLTLRIGCHSGPVTAGVLRGRKSHFQLFGDTVNTAARMESTGLQEKIQLSSDTAQLLIDSGRASWIKPREDIVEAKGKGEMQTYWMVLKTRSSSVATGSISRSSSISHMSETGTSTDNSEALKVLTSAPPQKNLDPKQLRLVQWNVEVLSKLLKNVIAKQSGAKADVKKLALVEQQILEDSSILAEVKETIALSQTLNEEADFLKRTASYLQQHSAMELAEDDVTIPDIVTAELTDYVTKVALLHCDENPFHNFEHTSHVIMATSKLLNRIVNANPSAEEKQKASTRNAGDVVLESSKVHNHVDTSYGLSNNPLCQFAVVFSALIHDVDNPGVSNAQLMKENEDVGRQYNNKSVAEQKSVDIAFRLLMQDEYKNLRHCIYTNEKQLKQFRQLLVNSVIATDIFDRDHSAFRKERWALAFPEDSQPVSDTGSSAHLDRKATIVTEHLIQASDVSHTMQHWHVYQKWNSRLFSEMYLAYKKGRSSTDPSAFWYLGELGFFDNYIIPLAQKLETCGVFGASSDEFLQYAQSNRSEWEAKGEEIVASLVQKFNSSSDFDESTRMDFGGKF